MLLKLENRSLPSKACCLICKIKEQRYVNRMKRGSPGYKRKLAHFKRSSSMRHHPRAQINRPVHQLATAAWHKCQHVLTVLARWTTFLPYPVSNHSQLLQKLVLLKSFCVQFYGTKGTETWYYVMYN